MQKQSTKIRVGTVLVFFLISGAVHAQESEDISYKFSHTDSLYAFTGTFKIKAKPECLLKICYEFDHVSKLAPDAKEVRLIASGNDKNMIRYTYRRLYFFENISVWSRKLNRKKQRVDFKMVSSKNNQKILPCMLSSHGFYKITEEGDYVVVNYYQQITLTESSLTDLYTDLVKKGAIEFMQRFFNYALIHCQSEQ